MQIVLQNKKLNTLALTIHAHNYIHVDIHIIYCDRYADYLVVTAYDFYTAESVIGHNTGLYGRSEDTNAYAVLNAVRALMAAGG